ncbi:MAG: hypothetical protein IJX52_04850 [Oscillibacter sp.]|nr:hypothetical protein [Oscillibacter sp.]
MIRKLRIKFVAICMALVSAVLLTVLAVASFSLEHNITNISDQILRRALQEDNLRPTSPWRSASTP